MSKKRFHAMMKMSRAAVRDLYNPHARLALTGQRPHRLRNENTLGLQLHSSVCRHGVFRYSVACGYCVFWQSLLYCRTS